MRMKGWMALSLCALVFACCSCRSSETANTTGDETKPNVVPTTDTGTAPKEVAKAPASGGLFSCYNLHYFSQGNVCKASYANWTECPNHAFLTYNTAFKVGPWGRGFRLTAVDTGMVIYFEYNSTYMSGMSAKEYLDTIMSPTPVSYANLSAVDQEGIKAGKAILGMSKEGVMIALGYPAKSKTPSTDLDTWVYWKGRFNTLTVTFSKDGKVGSLQ